MADSARLVDAYGVMVLRETDPPPYAADIRRDFALRCGQRDALAVFFPSVKQDGRLDDQHHLAWYAFVTPLDAVYALRRSHFVERILMDGSSPALVLCPEVWTLAESEQKTVSRGSSVRITHGPWTGVLATVLRVKRAGLVVRLQLRSVDRVAEIDPRWVEPV